MWQLDKLLKAMHTLFHNVPARREDYSAVTKSTVFPLSFCGHWWIENLPVVERALAVWPSLHLYMDAVRRKKLPNPGTASFNTIEAVLKDPLILAKLQFYITVARTFNPFLKKYQTDEPVMPFLSKHLAELIKGLLRRFIKRALLQDITTLQLTKLAPTTGTVKTLSEKCRRRACSSIQRLGRWSCLDPSVKFRDQDRCKMQMKCLVQTFLQDKGSGIGFKQKQRISELSPEDGFKEGFMSAQPIGGRLAWTTSLLVMLTKRPYHSLSTRPMEKQIYQKIEVYQYRHELVVQTEAQIFSVIPRFLDIKGLVNQDFLLIFDDETSSKRLEKWDTVLKPKVKLAKSLTTTTDLRHLLK